MTRFRVVALSTGVALAVGFAVASAGTPFGGDDGGRIPSDSPNGPVTKCESGVATAASKLIGAILKCHAGRTTGKYASDSAEETCENTALTKFATLAGCSSCASAGYTPPLGFWIEDLVDCFFSAKIYCDPAGTPFGPNTTSDDACPGGSLIPPDAPTGPETICSNGVGTAVGKLVRSITKCHIRRAQGRLTSDSAENGCESTAEAKFATTTKTAGCPACIGSLTALASFVERSLDTLPPTVNGPFVCINCQIWCGSPSGAFLP
jgi:hypothetical protein